MNYYDYYYPSYGSLHQNGNSYFPTTRYLVCRTYGHGFLDCTLVEAVYPKEKEFQSSQWDLWKLKATTIPAYNTPPAKTPDIDIPELNIKETPNCTHMWTVDEWAIRNAPIVPYDPWTQQPEQSNLWYYNIKIELDKEKAFFFFTTVTIRLQSNVASAEAMGFNQGDNS